MLVIDNVIDIPEADLILVLKLAVTSHRQRGSGDAMQVDSPEGDMPSLFTLLASVVRCPTSPAAMRTAIHQRLSDAEDIVCVLEVIDKWLVTWSSQDASLLPSRVSKNSRGVFEPVAQSSGIDIPPLDKVSIPFCVTDA